MHQALDAQVNGSAAQAATLYEAVLAVAPLTFDALHMLGALKIVSNDFDAAEALILRAIKAAGDDAPFAHNLQLCRDNRRKSLHSGQLHAAAETLLTEVAVDHRWATGSASVTEVLRQLKLPQVQWWAVADAFSAGSWIVTRASIAALASEYVVECRLGANAILSRDDAALTHVQRLSSAPFLRVLFGVADIAIDLSAERMPAHTLAIIDRDVSPDAMDIVLLLCAYGHPFTLFATTPFLAAKFNCSLLNLELLEQSPAMLSTSEWAPHRRMGAFIPDADSLTAAARWRLLTGLRKRFPQIDLIYPRPLPAEHLATTGEHLISVLDPALPAKGAAWQAFLYWGGSGKWRQFDVLLGLAKCPVIAHISTGKSFSSGGTHVHYFCDENEALAIIDNALSAAELIA